MNKESSKINNKIIFVLVIYLRSFITKSSMMRIDNTPITEILTKKYSEQTVGQKSSPTKCYFQK